MMDRNSLSFLTSILIEEAKCKSTNVDFDLHPSTEYFFKPKYMCRSNTKYHSICYTS